MYFEEYKLGQVFNLEKIALSKKEIIAFASKYDPRDFHLYEDRAKETIFNGLIASGFHTLSALQSNFVKTRIDEKGMTCGISIDVAKLISPVYPNMDIFSKVEVTGKEERSDGKTGVVKFKMTAWDKDKKPVVEMATSCLIKRENYI